MKRAPAPGRRSSYQSAAAIISSDAPGRNSATRAVHPPPCLREHHVRGDRSGAVGLVLIEPPRDLVGPCGLDVTLFLARFHAFHEQRREAGSLVARELEGLGENV